ncbi:MAG: TonB-dependent copper receptor [Azoarcus sp.]|jgi:iron complex outermembrane receptor protein|nr:TonB-dependent copper receptor [Azoarcus sp.]
MNTNLPRSSPRPGTWRLQLALLLSALFPATLSAQTPSTRHDAHAAHASRQEPEPASLAPIVITTPAMDAPLEVHLDPKAPQQPLPANDGASLLKTIPGMNLIRKGGIDGDPVFRGMAASRLNILLDGEQILGGCGGRMDPPTAYIFPDAYDRVTLLKGPQNIVHGPASAGTVLFERKHKRFSQPGWRLNAALTGASAGRTDSFIDLKGGNRAVYAEGILTHARSDDYKDGNGDAVHSRYERQSATAILGLTPDDDTRIELSAIRSDAEAAYADRGMDGSRFHRENQALKFEKAQIGGLLDKVEASAYYNYVDHVMDNEHLRRGAAMPMASNPDRETRGGRLAFTLTPRKNTVLILGGDLQANKHAARSGTPRGGADYYRAKARTADARFENRGLFSELTWQIGEAHRLIGGLRVDRWQATDKRQTVGIGSGMMTNDRPNPSANQTRRETLTSGFIRLERDFTGGTAYIGLGRSERAPDFWELIGKEAAGRDNSASLSAFARLKPEKTSQIDAGANFQSGSWQAFVSVFYNRIDDYILIESQYAKPAAMGTGTRAATIARNIGATAWGGEAGFNYRFSPDWRSAASLAYVHGENNTDHHALAQMPPLEGRLGLDWQRGPWSTGALLRLVAAQNRHAVNQGNIVGQDLGKSGGFAVFSLNGAYRWNKDIQINFGIDNLFDKTYAEFISRSGEASMIQGYEQTTRVNEPGRTLWIRARIALD